MVGALESWSGKRAVGVATFPLGELTGAETAIGEMFGDVEVGDPFVRTG
jgi:hypothetical protein